MPQFDMAGLSRAVFSLLHGLGFVAQGRAGTGRETWNCAVSVVGLYCIAALHGQERKPGCMGARWYLYVESCTGYQLHSPISTATLCGGYNEEDQPLLPLEPRINSICSGCTVVYESTVLYRILPYPRTYSSTEQYPDLLSVAYQSLPPGTLPGTPKASPRPSCGFKVWRRAGADDLRSRDWAAY